MRLSARVLLAAAMIVSCVPVFASPVYDYSPEKKEKNLKRYRLFGSYAGVMGEEPLPVAGHSEARRLQKNMRLYEKKLEALTEQIPAVPVIRDAVPKKTNVFSSGPEARNKLLNFMEKNITRTQMPLSFKASREYWRSFDEGLSMIETVMERVLIQNSLNIYDGALWQMALSISERSPGLVDRHTERLLAGEAGEISSLRGAGYSFRYGDDEVMMDRDNGFFFRMISDRYIQDDPLGQNEIAGFPGFDRVHHEDWKPVTGEQAWAAIIGPLQVGHRKYHGDIPLNSSEMKLALSVLPALEAMQSPAGAFYHAPRGTFGIHPKLISNENNFSVYTALAMLEKVLAQKDPAAVKKIRSMKRKLEKYIRRHTYDRRAHQFYLGGFYVEGKIVFAKLMAADCQTWAIAALGPEWIDSHWGKGESYKIWKNLISASGRYDGRGNLEGIGFAADHEVISVEWTCGAILAARLLADFYKTSHSEWSAVLLEQSAQMRRGIEKYKQEISGDQIAYLYASDRYFIPFGWWANPIPSIASSAWVLFTDLHFNPFELGGGAHFHTSGV